MKNIALAILSVGLCFYVAYLKIHGFDIDYAAGVVATVAAVAVFTVK